MKIYLVMDIGCIECGEESDLFLFRTHEEAEAKRAELVGLGWRGGQHAYEIKEFEV